MVNLNKLLPIARLAVFGIVTTLSLVIFALAAHIISWTNKRLTGFYYPFAALGLATAILSLATIPVMYFLSVTRKGAFTSMVAVEVGWFWFLWIMWIATAGSTTWVNGITGSSIASQAQALEAFAFLNWFALLFYTTTLFVVSIISHTKGNGSVWTSSVTDFDFNTAVSQSSIPAEPPHAPVMAQQQQYYPPQNSLMPQGVPVQQFSPQPTGTAVYGQPNTPQQPPVAMV